MVDDKLSTVSVTLIGTLYVAAVLGVLTVRSRSLPSKLAVTPLGDLARSRIGCRDWGR